MTIQEERIGDLSALVRIQLAPEDYQSKVEESLREVGRKVQLKGFRQGKVPKGLVRKMYGNQVLAEQLDKLVRENLNQFLKDKEFRILGKPLPREEESLVIDVDKAEPYAFTYELGLSPEFSILALSTSTRLERDRIQVDEERLDAEWNKLLQKHGQLEPADSVQAGDLLYCRFVELDDAGEILPGGLMHDAVINQDMIADQELAARSQGMGVGSLLVFPDLAAALDRSQESVVRYMLGVKDQWEQVGKSFRAEITGIKRNTPAQPDAAFLERVFGPGRAATEQEARAILAQELEAAYNRRLDQAFNDKIAEHLMDQTEIPLPLDFLRRWLQAEKEDQAPVEDAEFEYFHRNLRWSLIYNKVVRDNSLKVANEEVEAAVQNDIRRHYGPAFDQLDEEDVRSLSSRLLNDQEYMEKVYSTLMDAKVFQVLRESITIADRPVTPDEYEKSLTSTGS